MSSTVAAMPIEFVAVPVLRELASRRGIQGVTAENLKAFAADPERVLNALKANPALQRNIVEDLADGIDNVLGDIVNGIGTLFAANTPGGAGSNDS